MTTRISGLSGSGLDIDSLVQNLMKAQRVRYDQLYQKKTQAEWKKTDYNTIYNSVNDYRDNTLFNYKLKSTLVVKGAVSSDESKATVTATSDAANINHALNITQLAAAAAKTSSAAITTGGSKDTLANQLGIDPAEGPFQITVKNGTSSAAITVDPSKSIYDFVNSINNANLGIKANYDVNLDRVFLNTTSMGSNTSIELTDKTLTQGVNAGKGFLTDLLHIDTATVTGKNAEFTLDGASLSQNSNSFMISGIQYSLKNIGTVNVNVTNDKDKVVASVKAFIDSYNKTLDKINTELNEEKYPSYMPLTDSQKSEMKEADVTAWEAKAKSGLLHNDSTLRELRDAMRNGVANKVSGITGKYNSAASIGITSGKYYEYGKLYLDETKLRAALDEDPEAAYKIIGTVGETSSENGIAARISDAITAADKKIEASAGKTASATDDFDSTLGKLINDYNKNLDRMQTRLTDMENTYYQKYSALETALSKLNQQSSWLAQQLGS